MKDFYLKTNTEKELWDHLVALDLAVWVEETSRFQPRGINLDIIGTIYEPTGNAITTAGGYQFPETVAVPGFHANIRADLTEEQQAQLPLVAAPATPYRVWA
jgi:hypothetical protein